MDWAAAKTGVTPFPGGELTSRGGGLVVLLLFPVSSGLAAAFKRLLMIVGSVRNLTSKPASTILPSSLVFNKVDRAVWLKSGPSPKTDGGAMEDRRAGWSSSSSMGVTRMIGVLESSTCTDGEMKGLHENGLETHTG